MRTQFKIMYPKDHSDVKKQGQPYRPKGKDMVVMNNKGIFFLFNGETYYPSIRPLCDVLSKYDVIWKGGENDN